MARRLIICSDGTWNSPDDVDRGKVKPTNITKLSRAIKPLDSKGDSQIVFYDEGVGTGWGQRFIGGITGKGLSDNVLDGYRFLSHNYVVGDDIYLFGFSRGAYTSRSLCGFLTLAGVVDKKDIFYLESLYELYKHEDAAEKIKAYIESKNIRTTYPRIKMLGVFDTVGALGIPLGGLNKVLAGLDLIEYQFHDVSLSESVDYAYHALAIDEMRVPFEPTLWTAKTDSTIEMEQRWFCGVHSNIGGGYHPDGLANLALQYMVRKARQTGLEFNLDYLSYFKGQPDSELRESMTAKYRVLGKHLREINLEDDSHQVVDASVFERIKMVSNYRPENVPL